MTVGIDGLVSGLDTTSLINSLMTAESTPETLLKNKVTTTQTFISALQTLNSTIADLATKSATAAKSTSLDVFAATSSSSAVTATASATARPGSVEFTVGQTAQAQVEVTAPMTTWSSDAAPTLTIVGAGGTRTQITAASNSIDDVANAINKSASGVKAVKVASGTAADGTTQYRLQLSASSSGAAGAFTVYRGSTADLDAGTATDVASDQGAAVVKQARDASVTLYAGTAAAQTVTSATNTFSDLVQGVSVTVSAVSTDPVTVTVGRDTTAASTVASNLVSSFNAVLSYYQTSTAVGSTTSTTGTTTVTAGALVGDATSRDAIQSLTTAMSTPIDGKSPSTLGISIQKDGTFTFDQSTFQAALAADPDAVQTALSTLAQRVADSATRASDKYTGSVTTAITGQQSVVTDLGDQITRWDDRLAARRASLQTTYSNLEVQLQQLQSQSSWLTSQISALSGSTSSSSSSKSS